MCSCCRIKRTKVANWQSKERISNSSSRFRSYCYHRLTISFILTVEDTDVVGDEKTIVIDFPNLCAVVKEKILIEDGQILLTPTSINLQVILINQFSNQ